MTQPNEILNHLRRMEQKLDSDRAWYTRKFRNQTEKIQELEALVADLSNRTAFKSDTDDAKSVIRETPAAVEGDGSPVEDVAVEVVGGGVDPQPSTPRKRHRAWNESA